MRSPPTPRTVSGLGTAIGLVAAGVVAAGVAAAATVGPAADAGTTGAVERIGGVPLPPDEQIPEPDLTRHDVDLDDILLITGAVDAEGTVGALPLSETRPDQLARHRDSIPPIERPRYVTVADADPPGGDDGLVLGFVADDGKAYAYPIAILNRHEIVNERLAGTPVVITYCPLCRSGVVYDRRVGDHELTFGNTNALYDNDLVLYDHQTNSFWWQLAGRAIVGELTGARLEAVPSSMMRYADWVDQHPGTLVLSTDTGFDRHYGGGSLDGYQQAVNAGSLPFDPTGPGIDDDRLRPGDEVVGVAVGDEARAYPLEEGPAVVNDEVGGRPLVVLTTATGTGARVFDRAVDGRTLAFEESDDGDLVDRETGSTWSASGEALSGPLVGAQLTSVPSRTAFWFAFASAFPHADVAGIDAS